MTPEPPPATGARRRDDKSPWADPDEAGQWIPTDLGEGRTLWRPPPALKGAATAPSPAEA